MHGRMSAVIPGTASTSFLSRLIHVVERITLPDYRVISFLLPSSPAVSSVNTAAVTPPLAIIPERNKCIRNAIIRDNINIADSTFYRAESVPQNLSAFPFCYHRQRYQHGCPFPPPSIFYLAATFGVASAARRIQLLSDSSLCHLTIKRPAASSTPWYRACHRGPQEQRLYSEQHQGIFPWIPRCLETS